jgi:hypothetical protein
VATPGGDRQSIAQSSGDASLDELGISSQRVSDFRKVRDLGSDKIGEFSGK